MSQSSGPTAALEPGSHRLVIVVVEAVLELVAANRQASRQAGRQSTSDFGELPVGIVAADDDGSMGAIICDAGNLCLADGIESDRSATHA